MNERYEFYVTGKENDERAKTLHHYVMSINEPRPGEIYRNV